jgi:hypothetical protein
MPGRESAAGGGRSRSADQAEIVRGARTSQFISYFNAQTTTSTGEMYLQIENCIIGIN